MFGRVVTATAGFVTTVVGSSLLFAIIGAAVILLVHVVTQKLSTTPDDEAREQLPAAATTHSTSTAPDLGTILLPVHEHLRTTPEAAGWRLACSLDGLKAYARPDPGEFAFRLVGTHTGSTPAQWVVLFRELDLLPEWLSICSSASVLRLASPTELWPLATFTFPWVWMLPPLYVLLHVRLQENFPGEWVAAITTDETFNRAALPPGIASYSEVFLSLAVARLAVADAASDGDGRTDTTKTKLSTTTNIDAVFKVPIRRLTFLGPARLAMAHAPAWLVTLAAAVVIPFLWSAFIATLASKVVSSREPTSPWRARLREDATGLYALMSRR